MQGLWDTTVGKKVAMALTGLVLVGFVLGHMAGNLKAFLGAASFNHYAEGLRSLGDPLLPHGAALWIARVVLLGAVAVHITAAVQTTRASRAARPVRYRKAESLTDTYASRTMRWGGVVILLFVIYHLLHLTIGTAHTDFVPGDPYRNLVLAFQNPLIVGFYVLAVAALMLHLHHGVWSVFQTLGTTGGRLDKLRRPLALAIAWVLFLGFVSVPLGVQLGAIALP